MGHPVSWFWQFSACRLGLAGAGLCGGFDAGLWLLHRCGDAKAQQEEMKALAQRLAYTHWSIPFQPTQAEPLISQPSRKGRGKGGKPSRAETAQQRPTPRYFFVSRFGFSASAVHRRGRLTAQNLDRLGRQRLVGVGHQQAHLPDLSIGQYAFKGRHTR
jgi:hypothetical protein